MDNQSQFNNSLKNVSKKVLFLGYDRNQTKLINALENENCVVDHSQDKIESTHGFDLVISYGYRHLIKKSVINDSKAPIINLHISYLPWNRGAHPNFWSFFDCTPSGVSIHLVDEGLDTGPILFQRYVNFSKDKITFSQTYNQLVDEIETLFKNNIHQILSGSYKALPQRRKGSYHKLSDLPEEFSGWDSIIEDEIRYLDALLLKKHI